MNQPLEKVLHIYLNKDKKNNAAVKNNYTQTADYSSDQNTSMKLENVLQIK